MSRFFYGPMRPRISSPRQTRNFIMNAAPRSARPCCYRKTSTTISPRFTRTPRRRPMPCWPDSGRKSSTGTGITKPTSGQLRPARRVEPCFTAEGPRRAVACQTIRAGEAAGAAAAARMTQAAHTTGSAVARGDFRASNPPMTDGRSKSTTRCSPSCSPG